MKKIWLILIVALTAGMIACSESKEDDELTGGSEASLNEDSFTLKVGDEIALGFMINGVVIDAQKASWKSSDNGVATVNAGVVKGVKAGKATVTASSAGASASCQVTVTGSSTPEVTGPAVGDYYYSDGTFSKEMNSAKTCLGVVFRAKTKSQSGLIVSHDERGRGGWWVPVTPTGYVHKLTNANNEDDGAYNLGQIKKWNSWERWYPGFNWCAEKGNGWYMPAINELKALLNALVEHKTLSERIAAIPDGDPMKTANYWSSTEKSASNAVVLNFGLGMSISMDKTFAKSSNVLTRAVRAF